MDIWSTLFGDRGTAGIDQAINNLVMFPLPDLSDPAIKALFSYVWGFAILLAIVTGGIAAVVRAKHFVDGTGSPLALADAMFFWLKVVVVGFLAPPITALLLFISYRLTVAVQALPQAAADPLWLQMLKNIAGIGSPAAGVIMGTIDLVLAQLMSFNVAMLTFGVLPVLVLTPIFYAFSILGQGGLLLWRIWRGILLVTVTAKPVVAWILAVGRAFIDFFESMVFAPNVSPWIAYATLAVAAWSPLVLAFVYAKQWAPGVQPASIRSTSSAESGQAKKIAVTGAALGVTAAGSAHAIANHGSASGHKPGARRKAVSAALGAGALLADTQAPGLGRALKGAATAAQLSAGQAQSKAQRSARATRRLSP